MESTKPDYPVHGPDVSEYQTATNPITFEKMQSAGASFVIMRSGFGIAADRDIHYNATESAKYFDHRGTYWFPDHRYPTRQYDQLQAMREVVYNYDWEIPITIDIEHLKLNNASYFPQRDTALDFYQPFFADIKSKTGRPAMIYTNLNCLNLLAPLPQWMLECPLWIASWTSANEPSFKYFGDWTFWQTGVYPHAKEFGCDVTNIDRNVFNGTLQDLVKFCDTEGDDIIIDTDLEKRISILENKIESVMAENEALRQQYEDLRSVILEGLKNTASDIENL